MLEDACHDAGETLSVSEPGDGGRNGLYQRMPVRSNGLDERELRTGEGSRLLFLDVK